MINKVSLEPAFVLHTRPYQETSILVDFFTRSYGRLNAIAKGAKKPKSPLRSVLTPASKLSVSLSGKSELKTLSSVEIIDHFPINNGVSFNSIVYVNELIIKATEKEDPHLVIFDNYEILLKKLSYQSDQVYLEENLRNFELNLLQEMGYGIDLSRDAETNKKIEEGFFYRFYPDKGFAIEKGNLNSEKSFSGLDIINFKKGNFEKKETRDSSKIIMRMALDFHLGNKTLNIRKYLTKN
ncbi:MAG: DNA repair protein RecO [Pseudomonadota bacterium]|nr:DNA repair protein RecO [Pseudomonadota bacterium]